ncbi:hypothetical protein SNE40_019609 [Patella caerulea]|uniref:28S ribosomal protein S34, mitochondrial n=1 Tax=Patella caerulea TaxID=87958 RepID=A0AAN8PG11_PATCE
MRIRYVGRIAHFKGKTLYEIACNLKNFGEGRVVTRLNFLNRYPEKSYYRLTKVQPDLTDLKLREGVAWGEKIFRGDNLGVRKIETGQKTDWKLIPKEEETDFCKLTEKDKRDQRIVPATVPFPPFLEAWLKQDLRRKGKDDSAPFVLNLRIEKSFTNRAKLSTEQ